MPLHYQLAFTSISPHLTNMNNIFNQNGTDQVREVLTKVGFTIEHSNTSEAREPKSLPINELNLSEQAEAFWPYPMWTHQFKAIKSALEGHNVCVSTSTSSGKTEIFQTVAIETIARKGGKVLAFYCVKALNAQQQERWNKTGLKIGIIDGNHQGIDYRRQVFENSDVVLMTPDVMHIILSNLQQGDYGLAIKNFIKQINLVIIDEIHLYRGVFGSNTAYLFRRINNLRRHYRKNLDFPLYITASATIPNPAKHSSDICGVSDFVNIGMEDDKSPAGRKTFYYVKKHPDIKEPVSSLVSALIKNFSEYDDTKTITFVSGRQQTGKIAIEEEQLAGFESNKIYPFRAGFEDEAREHIYKAMNKGDFKGIISTSALEIGIDISGLNIAIIANMPFDRNSYYQRIGRVGRGISNNESAVIVVNDGSLNSTLLFDSRNNYDINNVLPDLEPALHLDSEAIMACHAACHVHGMMDGCELPNLQTIDDATQKYFPPKFIQLMKSVLSGNRPAFYDEFVNRNSSPHNSSLRSLGITYQIVENESVLKDDTVTRTQMLKEAYKGALRNSVRMNNNTGIVEKYLQRVTSFPDKQERQILTKRLTPNEYTIVKQRAQYTKPYFRTYVCPNFSKCTSALKYGDTLFVNLRIYERTQAYGYYECCGKRQTYKQYEKEFKDEIQTMGVLIFNPLLNNNDVSTSQISQMIFESFLLQRAFEKNDFEYKGGKLYLPNAKFELQINDRFLAIYDNNDLNIAKELLDCDLLKRTFAFLRDNFDTFTTTLLNGTITECTKKAVYAICNDVLEANIEYLNVTDNEMDENIISIPALKSKVRYHIFTPSPNNASETTEQILDCIVVGVTKEACSKNCVTYTLASCTDTSIFFNITMDYIEPIPTEPTVKFNWRTGCII